MTPRMTWTYLSHLFGYAPILSTLHALGWTLFAFTGLVQGWIGRELFDRLEAGNQPYGWLLWVLVGITLFDMAIWLGAGYSEVRMRFTMSTLIRTNLLRAILRRPGATPLGGSIGDTISRFRDDTFHVEDALDWRDEIVMNGVVALIAFGVLLWIDPLIACATVIPMAVVTGLARLVADRLGRLRAESRQATSDVTGAIGDFIAGIGTLQALGATSRAIAHFRSLGARRKRATISELITGRLIDALRGNLIAIGTAGIMLFGASRLQSGAMSIGDFVLFVMYFGIITNYVSDLGQFLAHFRQTSVNIERLNSLIEDNDPFALVRHTPLHIRGPLPPAPDLSRHGTVPPLERIDIDGLTCQHADGAQGVTDVIFSIERGQLVVVTGEVGAGKSTLLRALMGLLPLETGSVRWNGEVLTNLPDQMIPPRAAYLGQVPHVFSDSVRNNVLLGKKGVDVNSVIEHAKLWHDVADFPDGLETQVGSRGVRLSGGQVQRVAIARMLAQNAEFLVIDDLSSALDVETEAALWDRLFTDRPVTCLAVSHRRTALSRADKIVVMHRGHVVALGTLPELLERSEHMRRLWSGTA